MKVGSIIKTGNRYRAFLSYQGKRLSKYFATKQEAELWIASQQNEILAGDFTEPSRVTVGEWIYEYLKTYTTDHKANSLRNMRSCAKRVYPLTSVPLQKLNSVHVQRLLNSLKTPSLKATTYTFLLACLNKAVQLKIITRNPLDALDRPKYAPKEKGIFTEQEINKLKAVLPKFRHGTFFLLLMATGTRISEMLALTIDNVHDDHITINLNVEASNNSTDTPKTKSSIRDVTLPRSIINVVRKEWQKHGTIHGYIWSNNYGNHYTYATMYEEWRHICKTAGVRYLPPHSIRHTHATMLLQYFNIVEVQRRLGHSNPSITLNVYGHLIDTNKDKMIETVAKMVE